MSTMCVQRRAAPWARRAGGRPGPGGREPVGRCRGLARRRPSRTRGRVARIRYPGLPGRTTPAAARRTLDLDAARPGPGFSHGW